MEEAAAHAELGDPGAAEPPIGLEVAAERDRSDVAFLALDRPVFPAAPGGISGDPLAGGGRVESGAIGIMDFLDPQPGVAERKQGEEAAAAPCGHGGVDRDGKVDPMRVPRIADGAPTDLRQPSSRVERWALSRASIAPSAAIVSPP